MARTVVTYNAGAFDVATVPVNVLVSPLGAALDMGSHKITNLTNGAAAQDAAAFGQIPTALPPSGSAGGDLTGTYPNPTLAAAGGGAAGPTGSATVAPIVTVDAKGRVTALSSATIVPTNAAGGDLTGNYPNPTLANAGGGAAGPTGSATVAPIVTVDAKGRVTALSSATIVPTNAAGGDLTGNYPNPTIASAAKNRDFLAQSFVASAKGESFPRFLVNQNGAILSSGRLCCAAIPVYATDVLTNVSWHSVTTALSAGTHWWFALCDSSFNVIRQSTDQLATAWGSNTLMTKAVDSVPVTAGARVASTTVTLTLPTLSQALSAIFTAGDSIVVSNANIAAYNGTFTVATVGATTITYTAGSSATDSLSSPFPTVQLAAGKRTYTVPTSGIVYGVVMVAATVPTLAVYSGGVAGATADGTATGLATLCANGDTGLTGTCPSPIAHGTSVTTPPWSAVS